MKTVRIIHTNDIHSSYDELMKIAEVYIKEQNDNQK